MIYQVTIPLEQQLLDIAEANGFEVVTNLGNYVSQIVGLFLIVASLAAFIYMVLAGISWITAGSDKNKLEEAKTRLTNAIIGLGVVAVSWAIFLILNYFFGLGIAEGTPGSGGGGGGNNSALCSSSSAAQCQGQDPGDSCHNNTQTCVALNNQPPGSDGRVRCSCQ